jgi:hypothetical protein
MLGHSRQKGFLASCAASARVTLISQSSRSPSAIKSRRERTRRAHSQTVSTNFLRIERIAFAIANASRCDEVCIAVMDSLLSECEIVRGRSKRADHVRCSTISYGDKARLCRGSQRAAHRQRVAIFYRLCAARCVAPSGLLRSAAITGSCQRGGELVREFSGRAPWRCSD